MSNKHNQTVHFNKKDVIIPWFVLGAPEPDLKGIIEAVEKAVKAQK